MSGERQTVAGAYLKIAAHEELCAERYRGINEKLSWVLRSLVGMLMALLAWALVQLYALEPLRRGYSSADRGPVNGGDAAPSNSYRGRPGSFEPMLIMHQGVARRAGCITVGRAWSWEM